jgi:HK97 family phage portal protein
VIVRGRSGSGVEVRAGEFGSSAIPWPVQGAISYSGVNVTHETASALPAVSAAVRLVSETIASLPLYVRDGETKATGTAAWSLLMESPTADLDPFAWMAQVAGSVEMWGNAYLQIIRRAGRVVELVPLDPSTITVRRDKADKRKRFDIATAEGGVRDLTTTDILHIAGYTPPGHVMGMSPIGTHRNALGNGLALQRFSSAYWLNDAAPGMVIKVPGNLTQQQAQEILRVWNSSHGGGVMNSHKPGILAGGADLERIPINLDDAAFVEQARMSVEDVARIWRLPAHMLGVGEPTGSTAEQESLRFLSFSLMPRLRRIEMGIAHGLPELFGGGTPLRPEFDTTDLLRADTPTKTQAVLAGRQAGWLSINDARRVFSLPPIENGDTVQVTPVGGAPNLQPGGDGAA